MPALLRDDGDTPREDFWLAQRDAIMRRVRDLPQRIAEAARLGFAVAVVPTERRGPHAVTGVATAPRTVEGMRVIEVTDVASALRLLGVIRDPGAEAV